MARVFLSYRQENDAHCAVVLALAKRLEQEGLTVVLDQLAQERQFNGGGPNEGWPKWSTDQAGRGDNKVVIIGTASWFRAFEGTEVPGVGLGSAAEAGVIRQRLYNVGGVNPDIRIVSFEVLEQDAIPIDLQRYHRFVDPNDFATLVRWLTDGASAIRAVEEWPEATPDLSWVMANHDDVRAAFAKLITRNPPFRYLPIRGASGTGKTHVTKQLLNNALRSEGLACGRFDFKGVTDADAEMQRFVQNLDISVPPGLPTISRQLDAVLNALIARKRPALLIFDTFEAAGPLDRWVQDTLLVALIRQKWLRIVIVGQMVPEKGVGALWAAEALATLVLNTPSADHWFDFSKIHRPGLTLLEVQTVHKLASGNSALLAQMLGATGP
jgi:SEFIR domain